MNIFVLDEDPKLAAIMQCDKHIVKMILESAQMLCTAHRILDNNQDEVLYKATHKNHPCSVWVRENTSNYTWLYNHFLALGDEYTYRYGKTHKSIEKLAYKLSLLPENLGWTNEMTPFVEATGDIHLGDAVETYREYYRQKKNIFKMVWTDRKVPWWFK